MITSKSNARCRIPIRRHQSGSTSVRIVISDSVLRRRSLTPRRCCHSAGLGNNRPQIIRLKGRCSNLAITKCCNVILMVDEIFLALHVTESEEVSIIVRGAFPSPITIRGVNGIHITAGQNNIHSSVSGICASWHAKAGWICSVLQNKRDPEDESCCTFQ